MSTRAIIGIKNENGTITGGWQWNDGMGLISLLRKEFDTVEKIQELISNGVWNNIAGPRDKQEINQFMKWAKRQGSDYSVVPVGRCFLLKEEPCDNASFCFGDEEGITINADGSMTFADFTTANGQDINYMYLFNPVTSTWRTYTYQDKTF